MLGTQAWPPTSADATSSHLSDPPGGGQKGSLGHMLKMSDFCLDNGKEVLSLTQVYTELWVQDSHPVSATVPPPVPWHLAP